MDRLVDGFDLSREIWILGADDDASVRWLQTVQVNEIASVDRQDSSPYLSGELKDFGIRDRQGRHFRLPDWSARHGQACAAKASL